MQLDSIPSVWSKFLQLEEEGEYFFYKIDDVFIWERIRKDVWTRIIEKLGIQPDQQGDFGHNLKTYMKCSFRMVKNLFTNNLFNIASSDILFFSNARREYKDGVWFDPFFDPIIDKIPFDCILAERPHNGRHREPTKTENIFYLDVLYYSPIICDKTGFEGYTLGEYGASIAQKIKSDIEITFNISIDIGETISNELLKRRVRKPLYDKFLKKIDPKIAVIKVSKSKHTFIEICKERGIPVIELQHGVLDPYNPAYSYPGRSRKKRTFPDYFLSFGDFWEKNVELPINDSQIYAVGKCSLEKAREKYSDIELKNQVLFISQGTIGHELSKVGVDLEKQNLDFDIIYKLHPNEIDGWRSKYPWLVDSEVDVLETENIYRLFAESKIQVGVYSTAIYEGLSFGLDTYLLNLRKVDTLEHLYTDDHAKLVENSHELGEYLNNTRQSGDSVNKNEGQFFKNNACENSINTIEWILHKEYPTLPR